MVQNRATDGQYDSHAVTAVIDPDPVRLSRLDFRPKQATQAKFPIRPLLHVLVLCGQMDTINMKLTESTVIQMHQDVCRATGPVGAVLLFELLNGQPLGVFRPPSRRILLQPYWNVFGLSFQPFQVTLRTHIKAFWNLTRIHDLIPRIAEVHLVQRVTLYPFVSPRQTKGIRIVQRNNIQRWVIPRALAPRVECSDDRRFLSLGSCHYSINSSTGAFVLPEPAPAFK